MAARPRYKVQNDGFKVKRGGVSAPDSAATRRFLARLPIVHAAVELEADAIGAEARALFASHDHPGGHHIEVDSSRVDAFVSLVGPAPASVEFGHQPPYSSLIPGDVAKSVKGLHILGRAAHL